MPMTADQLRQAYLDFFKQRGHAIVPSGSMVPDNDPTTLFTGSGMQPMMPYLLGEPHPQGTRIADSQKCFRSQDIEDVGDNRHTTFFEMLGNWSLGDYFKAEQLPWFFEFLTEVVGLDSTKLYVSVYQGNEKLGIPRDNEAIAIWQELFAQHGIEAKVTANAFEHGMQGGRIFLYDEAENWWSRAGEPGNMPVGEPGGPDSEVFYDFGEEFAGPENGHLHPAADSERFLEIGNSVFMTYHRTTNGFEKLAQQNIDFGGGLERLGAAQIGNPDVFLSAAIKPLTDQVSSLFATKYSQADQPTKESIRVVVDHLRGAIMLASDGVTPGNKEQAYFSRRLVRRAIRFALKLGYDQPFITELVPTMAQLYQTAYPQLSQQTSSIQAALADEEQRFHATLRKGLREFDRLARQRDALSGQDAFGLFETYGFPVELTKEEAAANSVELSSDFDNQFQQAKQAHADKSRIASAGKFKGGLAEHSNQTTQFHTATHLLHAALRKILGNHVMQMGSNITVDRLRFDFKHSEKLTDEQKTQLENQINSWIESNLPVTRTEQPKQQALAEGALAFFKEKYPDQVSVYTIGNDPQSDWISKELCGGPHVTSTGQIPQLTLTKEQSSGSGVRRVYIERKP